MDEVVVDELAAGATQLVILGAGFDTRGYRFADKLDGAAVFEVDHPVTSGVKRERVRKAFGQLPPHVNYVAVDFENEDMAERLAESGYDAGARTVFVWSGVSMYITGDAVAGVLAFVRDRSGPASVIVFDYIFREFLEGADHYFGAPELRKTVERQGEPFRFGIPEGGAQAFVEEHGLELERHHTAADMPERYLKDASGQVAGRTYECGGLCVARRRA
jgi:methyltransferase (TIGR00027 family)